MTVSAFSSNNPSKSLAKRLLFVDDEPNIRATLPVILRRYGFTVEVAGTIAEALEKINNDEFGLLLCDLNIETEGDGYTVIRAMREKNAHCLCMILTGYPALDTAVEGIDIGIDAYMMKPTNADALVAILAEKLAKRQPRGRVLTVADDEPLLRTWMLLLESRGYEVASLSPKNAIVECSTYAPFDVLLLGGSIRSADKRKLVEAFRKCCPAPVIAVPSRYGDREPDGADYQVEPDPEQVLRRIAEVISKKPSTSIAISQTAGNPQA